MKRRITITLEAEIDLDLDDFVDCSEESELTESIEDTIDTQDFYLELGDDSFNLNIKSREVKEISDET